jgi:hypothetical protein
MRTKTGLGTLIAASAGATLFSSGTVSAAVTQGVPAPYVNSSNSVNASDPHVKPCVKGGVSGFCLFTSQDLNEGDTTAGYPSGDPNHYPMSSTLGFFSTDGITWTPASAPLLTESAYTSRNWVPSGAKHLWAPSAASDGRGNWFLYVPDISNLSQQHTASFIGVSKSTTGPMGQYTPFQRITISTGPGGRTYASDPDVIQTSGGSFLFYANGDGENCGTISVAQLNTTTMADVTNPQVLQVSGFEVLGGCTESSKGQTPGLKHPLPYMEGPHVYDTSGWPTGAPGPYLLVVPTKPSVMPPECVLNVQGQPGTQNEVIAYATASSVAGPYTYQGILMCGSAQEYTDQASIVPIPKGGQRPLIMIYHDGPGANNGHHRTLHGECLPYGSGIFPGSIRTGGTTTADSGAIHDCLSTFDPNMIALKSGVTNRVLSGNGTLVANRFAVGPWEHFHLFDSSNRPIPAVPGFTSFPGASWKADANGRFVTTSNQTTPLAANSTTVGAAQQYNPNFSSFGSVFFYAPTGRGVRTVPSDGTLRGDVDPFGGQEGFTVLHY